MNSKSIINRKVKKLTATALGALVMSGGIACAADKPEDVLACARYGIDFHAAVQRGNVAGMQFHPEKSGPVGERMLMNFIRWTERGAADVC